MVSHFSFKMHRFYRYKNTIYISVIVLLMGICVFLWIQNNNLKIYTKLMWEGMVSSGLGDNAAALNKFNEATVLVSGQSEAFSEKSRALNLLKRYDEGLVAAETALTIDRDNMEAWKDKGFALLGLGKCVESSAAFYHVSINDPQDGFIAQMMGKVMDSEECKR